MGYSMDDEAETGSSEAVDRSGHSKGSRSEPAPLQSRAKFLQNWNWASVTQINHGLCERGRAQRGVNTEAHAAVAEEWEKQRAAELTLLETFQFLKSCHRRAPFLYFNGNTFAEIGRALANILFSDLPFHRRKEASSAIAHFITGVLDQQSMVASLQALSESADFQIGDRVKTLRGSARGVVLRLLADGRVIWRADGTQSELTGLPEGLIRE
jgi:hypothetical protein